VSFTVAAQAADSGARLGVLTLGEVTVATPAFMPVGTRGSVRAVPPAEVAALGVGLLLANTYHLIQRPGLEVLRRVGGLARWIGWSGAVLTDSGGFQVYSLGHACTIDDVGARFRPHPDGPVIALTPESAIAAQEVIGSAVMMVLDQCVATTSSRAVTEAAWTRTLAWARRSLAARSRPDRRLFAIVQGGRFPDLRRTSADALVELGGFDGYAIGGLAVGETAAEREDLTELVAARLPVDRPRYLMGVGRPIDLLEAVHRGVDLFDCILPTALAQQGVAFTAAGRLELRRAAYADDDRPLEATCGCPACALPRSYLHHLVKTAEPVGWQLVAIHNLRSYVALMTRIRAALAAGEFAALYRREREALVADDADHPPGPRAGVGKAARRRRRGGYEIVDGPPARIRHLASGEVMHVGPAPADEARALYLAQPPAIARALDDGAPVVVWDVGLGAAHNAMALVSACAAAAPSDQPIELVSFERDLDPLRLALAHPRDFPHLRHEAPHRLAATGRYQRARLTWTLHAGDALDALTAAPSPDVIWWDPFSPKVDAALWTRATFARVAAALARPCELVTYSRSTAVRTALLAAGFWVARGAATGAKAETTRALWPAAGAPPRDAALLDATWLDRRARSTAAYPADATDARARAAIDAALADHPQFAARPT
jgi:queuine tRNA-ribosyltransferase